MFMYALISRSYCASPNTCLTAIAIRVRLNTMISRTNRLSVSHSPIITLTTNKTPSYIYVFANLPPSHIVPNAAALMMVTLQPSYIVAASVPVNVHPVAAPPRYDKPVPGSTLRCLEDPIFDAEIPSPIGTTAGQQSMGRTMAADVLEKARDRFDRFWGGVKEENV